MLRLQAIEIYHKNGIEFGPAKAANAGGVAVSGLEMSQNSMRLSWSSEEVGQTRLQIADRAIELLQQACWRVAAFRCAFGSDRQPADLD